MSDEIAVPSIGLDAFGIQNARVATSLDLTKMENRKVILRCLQDCDKRLTEEVGEQLKVTDYFIHDVECRNEKTGEVTTAPRLVLIDKGNKTHECVSETLVGSLKNICFVYGKPPWPDGITLTPKMKRKGERNIYFFEVK